MELILVAVLSQDGFIAGLDRRPPIEWASGEDQARFGVRVAQTDWSFMGRVTHELAFKPERRRVVFSRRFQDPTWVEHWHLWLDPATVTWSQMCEQIESRHPLQEGLILGGTAVHDWFWQRRLIDRLELTVEPRTLGLGLPLLTGISDPLAEIAARGYRLMDSRILNPQGTRLLMWELPSSDRDTSG